MYKDMESSFLALCYNFRHCETFLKRISKIIGCPPLARIITTPAACRTPTVPFRLGSLIVYKPADIDMT